MTNTTHTCGAEHPTLGVHCEENWDLTLPWPLQHSLHYTTVGDREVIWAREDLNPQTEKAMDEAKAIITNAAPQDLLQLGLNRKARL